MNQELLNYIKERRTQGATDDQIRQALLAAGRPLDDINQALTIGLSLHQPLAPPTLVEISTESPPRKLPLGDRTKKLAGFQLPHVHWGFGVAGFLASLLGQFFYWHRFSSSTIASYITLFEFILLLLQIFILFGLAKLFRAHENSLQKSLTVVGMSTFLFTVYQFTTLIHLSIVPALVLFVFILILIWIIVTKVYELSWLRGFALGLTQGVLTGLVGLVVLFVFVFAGLLSLANIIRSTNNTFQSSYLRTASSSPQSHIPDLPSPIVSLQGATYLNKKYHYSFLYPSDWKEVRPDDVVTPKFRPDTSGSLEPFGGMLELQINAHPLGPLDFSGPFVPPVSQDIITMAGIKTTRIVSDNGRDIGPNENHIHSIEITVPGKGENGSSFKIRGSCSTGSHTPPGNLCASALEDLFNNFVIPSFKFN